MVFTRVLFARLIMSTLPFDSVEYTYWSLGLKIMPAGKLVEVVAACELANATGLLTCPVLWLKSQISPTFLFCDLQTSLLPVLFDFRSQAPVNWDKGKSPESTGAMLGVRPLAFTKKE